MIVQFIHTFNSLKWILILSLLFMGCSYFNDLSNHDSDFIIYKSINGPLTNMSFVFIHSGEFYMKGISETTENKLLRNIKGFYLQTTEVTQAQWQEVMNYNPSYCKQCGTDCPVENITWYEIQTFIKKLNKLDIQGTYRLPTYGEWLYAACKGTPTRYSWGDNFQCDKMNCRNDLKCKNNCTETMKSKGFSIKSTVPVKSFPPNNLGLYDMNGNVWEHVYNCTIKDPSKLDNVDYYCSPKPTVPHSSYNYPYIIVVSKGGGWEEFSSAKRNDKCSNCQATDTMFSTTHSKSKAIGFRLLKEIP